jgi:DNA-3-methyladenine glycosylase
MRKILTKKFFQRETPIIAKELLGMFLVRKIGKNEIAGMIAEVEVYDGFSDAASHASRGKTRRNEIMFREGGVWYVYFTYGMHWMLNIVTREKEYPAAILIRAACIDGVPYKKTNGPAKLTAFLKIDKQHNGKSAAKQSGLWIEDRGIRVRACDIRREKRVGIDYAGAWKHKPLRLYVKKV